MRTTVTLDDDLIADASAYSGITDKSKLINLALDLYIKRMAAKRLIALGGMMHGVRKRPAAAHDVCEDAIAPFAPDLRKCL